MTPIVATSMIKLLEQEAPHLREELGQRLNAKADQMADSSNSWVIRSEKILLSSLLINASARERVLTSALEGVMPDIFESVDSRDWGKGEWSVEFHHSGPDPENISFNFVGRYPKSVFKNDE